MGAARQTQADETRRRIFASAAQLFALQGYRQTTVEQIARHAGVAKGTFFLHFASKDVVITQLVRVQTRAARRAREQAVEAGGSPVARLRQAVMTLGEQASASIELSRAVLAAGLDNPEVAAESNAMFQVVLEDMVADARAAQAAGELARSPSAETIAGVLMASYLGTALWATTTRTTERIADVLAPLVDASLAAFAKGAEARAGARERRPSRARTTSRGGKR